MKLSQIKLFLSLTENHFNISRSAERMFIVQSAYSRQIQLLEEELQHPLFTRQGKRLTGLTTFGQQFLLHAKDIQMANLNIQTLAESWSERQATLTIATTHTQAKYFLPSAIAEIRKQLPKLMLRIEQSNPQHLVQLLETHQADCAICTEEIHKNERLTCEPAYQWRHGVVIPVNHRLAKLDKIPINVLSEYPIVTYVFGFTGRTSIQQAFEKIGKIPKVVLAAADSDVIKTYVKIGFGVGIVAKMCYQEHEDGDALCYREITPQIPINHTVIAWMKNKYFSPMEKQAIDIIIKYGKQFATVQ